MSILDEYKSCKDILSTLTNVIDSDEYKDMSDIDKRLVNDQLLHMQSAVGVMQMRMGRMGVEIPT